MSTPSFIAPLGFFHRIQPENLHQEVSIPYLTTLSMCSSHTTGRLIARVRFYPFCYNQHLRAVPVDAILIFNKAQSFLKDMMR